MNEEDRISFVKYRLEKAIETFEAAEILIDTKKWNSAINRLYYAAYYSISALLINHTISSRTHSGVKTQFFLHFVKTGLIDKKLGKLYSDLFDWRQKGDYGDFFDFSEEVVRSLQQPTRELIDQVIELLGKNNGK